MTIAIIKCPSSNFLSLQNAVDELGIEYITVKKPKDLKSVSKIILPGVSNFKYVASFLKKTNLMSAINKQVQMGVPYLGICIGMQLMCNYSTEGGSKTNGFGWVNGHVEELNSNSNYFNVPNMGWEKILWKENKIFHKNRIDYDTFYFCHSYHAVKIKNEVFAKTISDKEIIASLKYKNAIGVQFHPEKSGNKGLKFIEDFLLWDVNK